MVRIAAVMVLILGFALAPAAEARQDDPRLEALFERLLAATEFDEARRIEASIWTIWIESGDETLDALMVRGSLAMSLRDFDAALRSFDAIVEAAPDFAEGWNKRATLYWLMGEHEKSIADIDRTLDLEPRHFGALSGLAMIREARDEPELALDALNRAAEVHPQMVFLEQRIKKLNRDLGEPI